MNENSVAYIPAAGSYRRAAITIILSLLVVRLVLAVVMPVFADEAYTVVVTRFPSLSYYDHPTIAFGLPRLSMWLFGSEASIFLRLPHVLLGAASAWLIFLITRRAFSEAAAFWAVVVFSVAPYIFIGPQHFALPEGPVYFFMLLTLWLVLPELMGEEAPKLGRWVLAGLTLGLALLSKYTAALFGVSAFLWLLSTPRGRRLLASPGPWIAVALAILCTAPIFIWNYQNDWVTFFFQSSRTYGGGFSPARLLTLLLGQAMFLWPWTWALAIFAMFRALFAPDTSIERLFGLLGAVPILLFSTVSLISREMLPHWSIPGYMLMFPIVGMWCARLAPVWPRLLPGLAVASGVTLLVLAVLAPLQLNNATLTRALGLPSDRDFSWTSLRWDALREDFERRGIMDDPQSYIVPESWVIGGLAGYALGPSMPVAPAVYTSLHLEYLNDDRLSQRSEGYAIAAAHLRDAEEEMARFRRVIANDYVERGEPWFVTQTRAGVPVFEIMVVPVSRR